MLSVFLCIVGLIWGITLPSYHYYQGNKQEMIANKELRLWIAKNASNVAFKEGKKERPEGSLLEWVTGAAAATNLKISRFQPEGESKVRIWLNDVDYEQSNALLQKLISDFDIRIESLIIDRTGTPGLVNIQCTLS